MKTKSELRSWAKNQPRVSTAESSRAVAQLQAWLQTIGVGTGVLVYQGMIGEIDPGPVVETRDDLNWLTTRTPEMGPLTVHPYHSPSEQHPYGFIQPTVDATRTDPSLIEVAICPGLLFDTYGGRLGRGQGYYDQLLGSLPTDATKVGLTLDRLLVDRLPMCSHDQFIDLVITDSQILMPKSVTPT